MPTFPTKQHSDTKDVLIDWVRNMVNGDDPEPARDKAIENYQKRRNPKRSLYKIGDTLELPNGTVEVIGYDADGEPLVTTK